MSDPQVTLRLRSSAEALLRAEKIKYFIGFGRGTDGFHSTPIFISRPEDACKLIWNPTCVYNLSLYLLDEWRKFMASIEAAEEAKRRGKPLPPVDNRPVGIVLKGCDARIIIELLKEKIVSREKIYVLGIPCHGMIDARKAEQIWYHKGLPNRTAFELEFQVTNDGIPAAFLNGKKLPEFETTDIIMEKCRTCAYPTPLVYDELLDTPLPPTEKNGFEEIKILESLSLSERWNFWKAHITRCIRCNACRSICALCYCPECAVDPCELALRPDTTALEKATRPRWIDRSATLSNNLIFHFVRAIHMSGRCTVCGECSRTCPMNIPLQKLMKKVLKEVKEQFGYEPGRDIDAKPFEALAEIEDKETFII